MNRSKNIYFIGIGGIGMSALARYFRHEGRNVAGYDRVWSELSARLEEENIPVHYEDDPGLIPPAFRNPADTTVVYTPAVPADHMELNWFRDNGFEVVKRSKMLGLLSEGKFVMAVAGTHGKTTTSTMAAWFNSRGAGEGSAFLGGVSRNFGTNMVLGEGDRLVVEADEFDRSFLQLHPQAALVTSADADHLDIYGDHGRLKDAFQAFVGQIPPGGTLILNSGADLNLVRCRINIFTYSLDHRSTDFHARNIKLADGGRYTFDIVTPDEVIEKCTLGIPGLINVENCVGAVALVSVRGYDRDNLREAIRTFSGVARRFDFRVNTPAAVYMDDYAHHPRELEAMITSVRSMFPHRHLTVAFQPHLYTRTRDFAPGFAAALSLADRVLMLPIYPARELPIEGVTSEMILKDITAEKEMVEKDRLAMSIEDLDTDIVVTAGAGDIDRLCGDVERVIRNKVGK